MTPAEFNSLATQVQLEIFDKYFEEDNLFLRQQTNDSEYANRVKTVEEKISIFEEQKTLETPYDLNTLTPSFYKLGSVTYVRSTLNPFGPNYATTLEEVTQHEFNLINKSPLTRPSDTFPIFTLRNNQLKISPPITELTINYVRKPKDVRWGFTLGSLGQYLYDNRTFDSGTFIIGGTLGLNLPSTAPSTTEASPGLYTNIPTTSSGVGQGAVVNIQISGTPTPPATTVELLTTNTSFTISNLDKSSGYQVGDTLTVSAGSFGNLNQDITTLPIISDNLLDGGTPTTQGSIQFELSDIDQTDIILKILQYAGVIIRDPQIVQTATTLQQQDEVAEKT